MIKIVDLFSEYKSIRKEIKKAVERVLRSGCFILGSEVKNFEEKFAEYIGAKYCVGVNSGTDALYLGLLCAGIGRGDEVIVPVNTAIPTAMAVLMSGAKPVFIDCDESYLMDVSKVLPAITDKTKAIIPVHLYGRACDMERLKNLAKERKLVLIEDCAQAAGAFWRNKKVGAWGDFGCFSFYPTKNLGAYGDGGAIVTDDKNHYEKLKALRFYGQTDKYRADFFGINSRLDEMQAPILSVKLKYLDKWNERRREIAALYSRLIVNPSIILPAIGEVKSNVFHLFVVRHKQRDKLQSFLKEKGIETAIHYPVPLNRQPVFKESAVSCPRAEQYANEILSLPMHPFLTNKEIKKIAAAINAKL